MLTHAFEIAGEEKEKEKANCAKFHSIPCSRRRYRTSSSSHLFAISWEHFGDCPTQRELLSEIYHSEWQLRSCRCEFNSMSDDNSRIKLEHFRLATFSRLRAGEDTSYRSPSTYARHIRNRVSLKKLLTALAFVPSLYRAENLNSNSDSHHSFFVFRGFLKKTSDFRTGRVQEDVDRIFVTYLGPLKKRLNTTVTSLSRPGAMPL
ncbi:hypothetical protein CEXT_531321 [Caerostris extrusa]|uniref:Uncharacterized protein n=1 Tax=Caerostris extrusa TaxID=172846 RepID=A0AAV4Y2E8_CAEEX|nr:hypothetical protein CEXT_531321 [Caerostris extrusa]